MGDHGSPTARLRTTYDYDLLTVEQCGTWWRYLPLPVHELEGRLMRYRVI